MVACTAEVKPMDKLYSVEEAAALLRVTPRTIREWIATGRLGASKSGRTFIILESDIEDYLKRTRYTPKRGKGKADADK